MYGSPRSADKKIFSAQFISSLKFWCTHGVGILMVLLNYSVVGMSSNQISNVLPFIAGSVADLSVVPEVALGKKANAITGKRDINY